MDEVRTDEAQSGDAQTGEAGLGHSSVAGEATPKGVWPEADSIVGGADCTSPVPELDPEVDLAGESPPFSVLAPVPVEFSCSGCKSSEELVAFDTLVI
jgi:hypothetical protein